MSAGLIRNAVLSLIIASSLSAAAWAACSNCLACNCSYYAHGVLHSQCKCVTCTKAGALTSPAVTCCQTGETCSTDNTKKQNYEIEFTHWSCSSGTVYSCVDIDSMSKSGCCQ